MSGAKQFDEAAAVLSAAHAFWEKGFAGTSLSDLEAATGLGRSSLYNAFGSKEALYERALKSYADTYARPILQALEQTDIRTGIGEFFSLAVQALLDASTPPGCLAAMACLETGGSEGPGAKFTAFQLKVIGSSLRAALDRGVASGQLANKTDTASLALTYTALLRGLASLHKGGQSAKELQAIVRVSVGMLPPAEKSRQKSA
ncbi:MAG: TetR/AcrR family transcriptional regulator [Polaromonas sp.]|uniref:TetR/AcrR family transcriptional regulator n=1 Tax=Polaromonas sp. TaxID=1869339 RepID=UPI0017A9A4F5|nr:TetR/AcrR family transcriptional regulator [Polaromonas sp.]MBA3593052.1 TetR/AcrR family transcriptional regulator [Polaromonas sp.]